MFILAVAHDLSHPRPNPPYLSAQQAVAVSELSAAAANASAMATAQLLKHLDSNKSRTALATDCPQLANASAQDILDRLLVGVVSEGGAGVVYLEQLRPTTPVINLLAFSFCSIPHPIERSRL